jgi:hypothetical protein
MDACTIVGVDCATDPKNVGLARDVQEKGKLRITDVTNGQSRTPEETIGKAPLDVGADRIARTALSALQLLDTLSKKLGFAVPLAWNAKFTGIAAIEVYPAGTLRASSVQSSAYKRPEQIEVRKQMLEWLSKEMRLPDELGLPLLDPDALDAILCVLAGRDFLSGRAHPPTDLVLAQKEGWVWIRRQVLFLTGSSPPGPPDE